MPGAWYNFPEAQNILNNLSTSDISISLQGNKFIWSVKDALDKRLEVLRIRAVDSQVGYKLKDAKDYDAEDRWFTEEEKQASIHDRLALKFGDPNVLFGYGLETANKMWRKDSNVVKNILKRQKDIERVQKELEKAGRL